MIKEQFKKPFAGNSLNMFENTKQKFSIGLLPNCCFPRLNRGKIRFLVSMYCFAWIF